jgi:hypothetical protein
MASRTLEIVVNQSGNAAKGIDGLNTSLGKVEPAAKKASSATKSLGDSVTSMAAAFGVATTIEAAAVQVVQFGVDSVKTAAQTERLGRATEEMAKGIGESSTAIVASIQNASNHTISKMDAMQAANKAMMFGLVQNKEQMADLTRIAITLGNAMGQSATKSLDDLTTALGRQSPLILDNLGITLKLEDAHRIYAESLGKTVSELTAEEKQQAFVNAALEIGRKKVEELGGVTLDSASRIEQFSARWEDFKGSLGTSIIAIEESTGALENLGATVDQMTLNIDGAETGVGKLGMLLTDLAAISNPLAIPLAALGIDVIPNLATASETAADSIDKQAQAHNSATAAAVQQQEAIQTLSLTQIDTLAQLGQMEEAYNEKKEELLSRRLEAESTAAEATAENARTLNQQLTDNERERAERIKEINEKAAQDRDRNSGVEYQREIEKANQHFDERRTKIQESYTAENEDIKAKLNERQRAIDEQLEKERQQYEEKAQELKLIMAAQALEQSGQLEEMTGIAGITAEQYVQAVKFGAIEANREVETAMAGIVRTFEGHQKSQESIARTNAESIKRILGESATSSANSWKQATNSIVSDFERQAKAAYDARMAQTGSVSYSGGAGWSSRGARFAQGGSFTVPPGYPNDSFPMWVESGERVTVIPRDQASRMPKFANGTGISKVDQATNQARNLGYLNIDKSLQELQQYSSSVLAVASSRELLDFFGGGGDLKNAVKRAADLDKRIAASRAATTGLIKRPATKGTPSTAEIFANLEAANARRAKAKTASLTSTASPVSAAPTPSTGHTGQPMFNITIQYNPTIALGTQYELVQAIKPAFEELARLYKIPVSV